MKYLLITELKIIIIDLNEIFVDIHNRI